MLVALLVSWAMGGLARIVVLGPDPMPWKHQVGIGFVGTLTGTFVAWGVLGGGLGDHEWADFTLALVVSAVLVLAYRRWVRHESWFVTPDWQWWSRPTPRS